MFASCLQTFTGARQVGFSGFYMFLDKNSCQLQLVKRLMRVEGVKENIKAAIKKSKNVQADYFHTSFNIARYLFIHFSGYLFAILLNIYCISNIYLLPVSRKYKLQCKWFLVENLMLLVSAHSGTQTCSSLYWPSASCSWPWWECLKMKKWYLGESVGIL